MGGLIRIVPGHNVGELVWMDWMAKSNVLDLKNNLKIKGTFRKAIQLRKLTILKNKGP